HFDLMLHVIASPGLLRMKLEYSTALFKKKTIEGMARFYTEILKQVVENKDIKLAEISTGHGFIAAEANVLNSNNLDFDF
ncbi:MAG: hypothetical protein GY757_59755, partial [bacterium]|nr:hypothetical protein [bacterium]